MTCKILKNLQGHYAVFLTLSFFLPSRTGRGENGDKYFGLQSRAYQISVAMAESLKSSRLSR
jgi:hypothetical protein